MLLSPNTTKTMEIQEISPLHLHATNKYEQIVLFIPSLKGQTACLYNLARGESWSWTEATINKGGGEQCPESTEVGKILIVHLKPISQELRQIVKDREPTHSQTDWGSRIHTNVF